MYEKFRINLSERDREKLEKSIRKGGLKKKKKLALHFKKNQLDGDGDAVFLFTKRQVKQLKKANRKGVTILMGPRQIKANMEVEGGFLGMLAGLLSRFIPSLLSKVAPSLLGGLATGLVSAGVEKAIGGHGVFLRKHGTVYKVDPVEGDGLYLSPHLKLDGVYDDNKYSNNDGLFVRTKQGTIHDGKRFLLGSNSPFKNIPILGWIL